MPGAFVALGDDSCCCPKGICCDRRLGRLPILCESICRVPCAQAARVRAARGSVRSSQGLLKRRPTASRRHLRKSRDAADGSPVLAYSIKLRHDPLVARFSGR